MVSATNAMSPRYKPLQFCQRGAMFWNREKRMSLPNVHELRSKRSLFLTSADQVSLIIYLLGKTLSLRSFRWKVNFKTSLCVNSFFHSPVLKQPQGIRCNFCWPIGMLTHRNKAVTYGKMITYVMYGKLSRFMLAQRCVRVCTDTG